MGVGVQYLDIASSHLDIALSHLDIALSDPLRGAVVLLLQLNNLRNHLATGNKLLHECRRINYCMSAGMNYCMSAEINFHKSKGQSPIRVQYLRLHRNSYVQQNCLATNKQCLQYNYTCRAHIYSTYYLCIVHRKSLKTCNSCNLCLVHTSTVLKCSCV